MWQKKGIVSMTKIIIASLKVSHCWLSGVVFYNLDKEYCACGFFQVNVD